jgi:electron-transferring-flavoprotein dehydrogenase
MSAAGWRGWPRGWASRFSPACRASALVYDGDRVKGVVAGEFGRDPETGAPGPNYEPGMELHGKYVFLAEGVRGSLSKQVIAKYDLSKGH